MLSALGGRTGGLVVVCTLLLATGIGSTMTVGAPSGAFAATDATAESNPQSPLSVTVHRNGSSLVYRATVQAPAAVQRLRVDGAFGVYAVTDHSGFVASDNGYRLRDGRESGTLTLRLDLSEHRETPLGTVGPNGTFQAREDWAFAPSPRFHLRWRSAGDNAIHHQRLDDSVVDVRGTTDVVVGERFVFLGPHTVHTREVEGREIRIVVPAGTEFGVGSERSFDLFGRVQRTMEADADSTVTTFVLPETVRSGGAASGTDVWVRADAGEVTVAHEFAHASLSLWTTTRTRWLREAMAEYVAYRVAGPENVSFADRVRHPDASLTEPSTWPDEKVPYRKGAAVLAALDGKILSATDGEHSLVTLLQRLSTRREAITHDSFVDAVGRTAGEETASWLTQTAQSSGGNRSAVADSADSDVHQSDSNVSDRPASAVADPTASVVGPTGSVHGGR